MARLSTHVLDISTGKPAAGMRVELYRCEGDKCVKVKSVHTNNDGRPDALLLTESEMAEAEYELRFYVGDYFQAVPRFLNVVPLRFTIFDKTGNYHVPLLCSPWAYSTYRGS
ncbi:MAG TPA: hydroxyisourate hydrolase [Tepidisphaeraceae bacterium]|jgi:hydroxyisourate hydrolase